MSSVVATYGSYTVVHKVEGKTDKFGEWPEIYPSNLFHVFLVKFTINLSKFWYKSANA